LAADAPVLDLDLERAAPPDRADRTADHALRIGAGAAGHGDQIVTEARPVAREARDAAVGVGARLDAFVAARATLESDQQRVLRVVEVELDQLGRERALGGGSLVSRRLELLADLGHELEQSGVLPGGGEYRRRGNPHDLDVVERARGREAN